ncbi:MAG: DUF1822 family protein [Hydrococcus sp. Prado102]|jgi:hypothetical protein|nr:DUF1822 family protein [Hydrococcus sp. Prado102]
MNSGIQILSTIYSDHIWLEISEEDLTAAKPSPREYSNEMGRHYAFINRLCLNAFLQWMEANLELESQPKPFPEKFIWEVINGKAIIYGNKRLVIIPSDALDIQDFAIPQEWVDIPRLAGDYYLPVQIDLENRYLHIWGFVSRRTLKEKADYDPIYRTYYIESDRVITNLDMLWAACQLCSDEKGEVAALPVLSEHEAQQLITRLGKPSPYSPRLEAKFEHWGALLNESRWLEQLYQQRQEQAKAKAIVPLRHWLENKFDEAIQAGWLAVNTFGEMVPCMSNPSANTIKRAKLLNLKLQMRQQSIILLIAIAPEAEDKYGVLVQAHPSNSDRYLPANLSLTLRSGAGKELQTSVARERDNFIQLLYFRCKPKTQFGIELGLEGVSIVETFVI